MFNLNANNFTKLLIVITIFQFILSDVNSQSAWVRQDSIPGCSNIFGVEFINEFTGYCCGNNIRIRKTINGGQNWFSLQGSDSILYRCISTVGNNIVFVTGSKDVIYKSTDAGNSWTLISVNGGGYYYTSIRMLNSDFGYLLNYYMVYPVSTSSVLRTTDGGLNWNAVLNSSTAGVYGDIYCVNTDTAFLAGASFIWETVNMGQSWSTVTTSDQKALNAIEFVNDITGFAAGGLRVSGNNTLYPAVYKTSNGGNSWDTVLFRKLPGNTFRSISFYDENNGLVVGDSGIIFRTTNAGNKWNRQNSLYQKLNHVCFNGPNTAVTVGAYGIVYRTSVGGWSTPDPVNLISPFNDSVYVNLSPVMDWSDVSYNTSSYRILISQDSNFSNIILNMVSDTSGCTIPSNILFPNNLYYWKVRSENQFFQSPWSSIWHFSTNVPLPPSLISPLNNDTSVISTQLMDWSNVISAINYRTQIAADSNFNQLLIDTTCINSQFNVPYYKLFWNSQYYWRTRGNNNAGSGAWSFVWKFKTSYDYRPTLIIPLNNDSGIIYNALFDWENFPSATSYRLQISTDSIFSGIIYNNSYLYSSQYILKLNLNTNTKYYWRVNATTSSSTSFWSEIRNFRTSILYTGISNIDLIPTNYFLNHNYPNPFNPETFIKFQIPQMVFVKLSVYNILGEEITVLIARELNAGFYKTKFNAENLSSGIYFYKLVTDKFTDVKKMVVVK